MNRPTPAGAKPLAVTLYVPFCRTRCGYCDALVCPGEPAAAMADYAAALAAEISSLAPDLQGYEVSSLYVTGGSPNLLGGELLRGLLARIRGSLAVADDCETTLACTPADVSAALFDALARSKVDRLEFEQETFDAPQHLSLGQGFTLGAVQDAVQVAAGSRHANFDISLLYGLEGQSATTLASSAGMCARLGATHVTLRPLRLSEGTTVKDAYERQLLKRPSSPRHVYPDENRRFDLYRAGVQALEEHGYRRYTQHHFAREGFASRRVEEACRGVDAVGFGLGAESRYAGVYCRNTDDLAVYTRHAGDYTKVLAASHVLDKAEEARRRVADGLFAAAGMDARALDALAASDQTLARTVERLEADGLLERGGAAARLTLLGGHRYGEVRAALLGRA